MNTVLTDVMYLDYNAIALKTINNNLKSVHHFLGLMVGGGIMKEKVHDQMVTRTRALLEDALLELIEEKGFDGITIKDLTEKAGLNRGTFYLHYRDKYDLMEKVQEDILHGFLNILLQLSPFTALEYFSMNRPYPAMVQIFQYLKDHGRILKVLLGPKGDPAFPQKMKMIISNNFSKKLIDNLVNIPEDVSIAKEYMPAIGTAVNFGVIEQWLENGMLHSPEEMAMVYFRIIKLLNSISQTLK